MYCQVYNYPFFDSISIADCHKPSIVLLENVPGILTIDNGDSIQTISAQDHMNTVIPNKIIFIIVLYVICSAEGFSQERMQLNETTVNNFADGYTVNIIKANDCAAPLIPYMAAKKTIEDMGYDYDRTFRYFVLFQDSLYESEEIYDIVDMILTYYEFSAWNLKKAFGENLISDETFKITNYDLTVRKYNLEKVEALLYLSNKYNTTSLSDRQVIEGLAYVNDGSSNPYDTKTYPEEPAGTGWNALFSEEFQALLADDFLSVSKNRVEILKPESLNEVAAMAEYLRKARSTFLNN